MNEHLHHSGGAAPLTWVLLAVLALAAAGYPAGALRVRARGRTWPWWRTALWALGLAVAAVGAALPVGDFAGHMVGHVLLGMLAPLLLVCAAPVTLALRALPVGWARALSRLLRTPPVALLTHPAIAAVLAVGGLWVLYRTGLHAATGHDPLLGLAVQVHLLLAGYLFAAALAGPDPVAHRPRLGVRAAVLVLAVAAHNVLAKSLVAAPVPGVPAAEALAGGEVMYYLGAPVEIALFVLLGREWAARERRNRPTAPPARPVLSR